MFPAWLRLCGVNRAPDAVAFVVIIPISAWRFWSEAARRTGNKRR